MKSVRSVFCTSIVAATAGLCGCGAIGSKMAEVVVTAVPSDVGKCKALGIVATDSPETTKTSGLDQLRAQTVQRGGNTILVQSYALSTSGTAYLCDPPRPRP